MKEKNDGESDHFRALMNTFTRFAGMVERAFTLWQRFLGEAQLKRVSRYSQVSHICIFSPNFGNVMLARGNCENSIFQANLSQFTTRWSTMLSLGQCPIFWSSRVYSEKLIALMSLL